jgi:hypothetical protein
MYILTYLHKMSLPAAHDAGHVTENTRILQHSDKYVNKCLHSVQVLCLMLNV